MYLTFPELLILSLIIQHSSDDEPLSWRRLTDLFNAWVKRSAPDKMFIESPIGGMRTLELYLKDLRDAGMVTETEELAATRLGIDLINNLNQDYRNWPLRLPIEEGQYDLTKAVYNRR